MTRTPGAAFILLLATTGSAAAHKASDAFLDLATRSSAIEGRIDIALRDVEQAQMNIIKTARRLEEEGKLILGGKGSEEVLV